jgi:von Willebrand factor type A domain
MLFVNDASPSVPTCNLGPNGNVCACVDQPLLGQPPNLYFVLDRSGSMNDDNKWATIVKVLTEVVLALGPRVNVGVAVFPDPTGGPNTCAAGVPVVDLSPGDARSAQLGPTATEILSVLGRVGAQGGTPTAATLTGLLPLLKTFPGKTYVVLATDGGPNCNSSAVCSAAQCELDIESTAGCKTDTNCCAGVGGSLDCLDAAPTAAAVQALAANNLPVYVVGIPGSAPYATLLDQLAVAGGTARDPTGSGPQYYDVATTDEPAFQNALFQVAARVAGHCTLTLNAVPPNPNLVNVFLDEQPLATGAGCIDPGLPEASTEAGPAALSPNDAESPSDSESSSDSEPSSDSESSSDSEPSSDSESSSDSEPSSPSQPVAPSQTSTCNWVLQGQTVTILGGACQQIMSGEVLDVRVVAGCPTLIR